MQKILHSKILGKGIPLLILHGFLGSGDNWISLGRKFSEFFEVHLIDLRNHGRSFHDDEMDLEIMCEDVFQYCKNYTLEIINIIGHSMGGKVAMQFAVQFPNRVNKLVVVDIAPKAYNRRHDFLLNALQEVNFSKLKTRAAVNQFLSQSIAQESFRQFLLKNIYRKTKDELAFRFNLPVFVENYGQIVETIPPYSVYNKPCLFIRGANSDYILNADKPLIEAHFPMAQIFEIKNTGHWLHAENPKLFFEKTISFLNQEV